jgi:putative mRNA 3-end processing factor
MADPLIIQTDRGLYCPPGDFYVDAWKGVPRNIVTHAHSDHACPGSERYLTARPGAGLLRHRLGEGAAIDSVEYGETLDLGGVRVSLHPAGHVLGSAQVRIRSPAAGVCVVSGDYKRQADPTCRPFEPLRCDTFVTECTFGLPIFRWGETRNVVEEIHAWWRENIDLERTSILLAYSLGKAQRVLAELDPGIGPILLHGAVRAVTEEYRRAGVELPAAEYASAENVRKYRGNALVVAPPGATHSAWARKFAPFSTAIASGWMRVRGFRRRRSADRGFVFSDHVDFPRLLKTIEETGASEVIATHGYTDALVPLMQGLGKKASAFTTRFGDDEGADSDAPPSEGAEAL